MISTFFGVRSFACTLIPAGILSVLLMNLCMQGFKVGASTTKIIHGPPNQKLNRISANNKFIKKKKAGSFEAKIGWFNCAAVSAGPVA